MGYLGVFHLFQNVFENVKSGFSKFQNVKKPGFQNAKSSGLKMPECQDSGFSKMRKIINILKIRVFKVSGCPKGRRMPVDIGVRMRVNTTSFDIKLGQLYVN